MKAKDAMTYVFMALVLASFLSIAQLLTQMRDQSAALAKEIRCTGIESDIGCDTSMDISTHSDTSKLLTIK